MPCTLHSFLSPFQQQAHLRCSQQEENMDFGLPLNLPFKLLIKINICENHPIMFLRRAPCLSVQATPGSRTRPGLFSCAPPALQPSYVITCR